MSATTTATFQDRDSYETRSSARINNRGHSHLLAKGLAMSYHIGTLGGRMWSDRQMQMLSPYEYVNLHTPLPGEAVTAEAIEQEHQIQTAFSLIDDFAVSGFSWSGEDDYKISSYTADAAKALLTHLEPSFGLPKIAPNDAEGLVMMWHKNSVMLVVDQWKIHLVKGATTLGAQFSENIPFDGQDAPAEVIQALK